MTDKTLPFPHPPEAPAVAVAPLPVGAQVAHLRIARVLAESAHAIVYLTHADAGGEPIALMEYFPRALALRQPDGSVRARQAGDAIALSVAREGFVQDANTLQAIRHPGVMPVLGSLQAHRTVYRAMPFIDGVTLERQVQERDGPVTVGEVTRLLDSLLDALEALHKAGVVHGAVRPDQVLIAPDGHPVLLGMASAGAELAGHEPGPWSAPEQAAMSRHDRINSATDLYMAALTVWFAATGVPPPPLSDRLAKPHEWDPAVALAQLPEDEGDSGAALDRLAGAINAALALLPAERPQRVADLRALLHPGPAQAAAFEPSGTAPLWVGAVPDRESQWEVLDGGPSALPASGEVAPPPRAAAPSGAHERAAATPSVAHERAAAAPIDDARPVKPTLRPAADRSDGAAQRPWGWIALALLVLCAAVATAWWALRRTQAPELPPLATPTAPRPVAEVPVTTPPAPAPLAAPAAEPRPAPAASAVQAPGAAATASAAALAAPKPEAKPAATTALAAPALAAPKPTAPRSAVANTPQSQCSGRTQFALLYCLQEQCGKPAWRNHAQCAELRRRGDIR
jgi:hypothetical protein